MSTTGTAIVKDHRVEAPKTLRIETRKRGEWEGYVSLPSRLRVWAALLVGSGVEPRPQKHFGEFLKQY